MKIFSNLDFVTQGIKHPILTFLFSEKKNENYVFYLYQGQGNPVDMGPLISTLHVHSLNKLRKHFDIHHHPTLIPHFVHKDSMPSFIKYMDKVFIKLFCVISLIHQS